MYDINDEANTIHCRQNLFAFCSILIVVLITYSNTLNAEWQFDDFPNILNRTEIHFSDLSWAQIKNACGNENLRFYRPLTILSFGLNYYFFEKDPTSYHIINILIHIITAFILFLFIRKMLNLKRLEPKYGNKAYSIALLSSFLWVINPLQTQAITYIVQRMASMAAMFYLLSMYFYLTARISYKFNKKYFYYFLSFLFGFLAFGSKENTAILPITIILFEISFFRAISKQNFKAILFFLFLCFLVPFFLGLIIKGPALFDFERLASNFNNRNFTIFERILTQPRVLLYYLSLLIYPMPNRLSIIHEITVSRSFFNPITTLPSILIVIIIILICILKTKKYPLISFCILFFFLNHSIEASFLNLELVFEHRNYLPSLFIFIPISILLINFINYYNYNIRMKNITVIFVILSIIGIGHGTYVRNFIWRTEESLWMDAVDKNPDSKRAYTNLGRFYFSIGEREKALKEYSKVFSLPEDSHGIVEHITHYNLALNYEKLGNTEKAIYHLKKTLELKPDYFDAYNNLAVAEFKKGNYVNSYNNLINFLTYAPNSALGHANLSSVLIELGRIDDSIKEISFALAKDKFSPRYNHNLALAYKYKKEYTLAEKFFKIAIKYNINSIISYLHLAETLYYQGENDAAYNVLLDAIKLFGAESFVQYIFSLLKDQHFEVMPNWDVVLPLVRDSYFKRAESIKLIVNRLNE